MGGMGKKNVKTPSAHQCNRGSEGRGILPSICKDMRRGSSSCTFRFISSTSLRGRRVMTLHEHGGLCSRPVSTMIRIRKFPVKWTRLFEATFLARSSELNRGLDVSRFVPFGLSLHHLFFPVAPLFPASRWSASGWLDPTFVSRTPISFCVCVCVFLVP